MLEVFEYQFMQFALLGGVMIATLCAMIGTFLVPQRFSLLGDGLAHLAFGGIAIGLVLGLPPLLTAAVVCVVGALYLSYNRNNEKVYGESAIAVLLTLGMAIAILLISIAGGFNVDLFGYLFGSILTITSTELYIILLVLLFVSMFMWYNYHDLCLYTFHQGLARVSGVHTGMLGTTFSVDRCHDSVKHTSGRHFIDHRAHCVTCDKRYATGTVHETKPGVLNHYW